MNKKTYAHLVTGMAAWLEKFPDGRLPYGKPETLHPVLAMFGQWAVTTYGIECTWTSYPIPFRRVREIQWERHMGDKLWVEYDEFCMALLFAESFYLDEPRGERERLPLSLRFEVLKRDNYRCRLCGKSTPDGARLEVDHLVPASKGGSDVIENLQTLCFECNRGKSDKYQ